MTADFLALNFWQYVFFALEFLYCALRLPFVVSLALPVVDFEFSKELGVDEAYDATLYTSTRHEVKGLDGCFSSSSSVARCRFFSYCRRSSTSPTSLSSSWYVSVVVIDAVVFVRYAATHKHRQKNYKHQWQQHITKQQQ